MPGQVERRTETTRKPAEGGLLKTDLDGWGALALRVRRGEIKNLIEEVCPVVPRAKERGRTCPASVFHQLEMKNLGCDSLEQPVKCKCGNGALCEGDKPQLQ